MYLLDQALKPHSRVAPGEDCTRELFLKQVVYLGSESHVLCTILLCLADEMIRPSSNASLTDNVNPSVAKVSSTKPTSVGKR